MSPQEARAATIPSTSPQPEPRVAAPRMSEARWKLAAPSSEAVEELTRELGISKLLATLLVNRHIDDVAKARRFLYPALDHLHDPFLMRGMDAAVTRLLAAIASKETILIYGDYDVDGATAVIVLRAAIARLGGKSEFHIPHRINEGYGMREDVLDRAAERGIRLVVSVDTGIRAGTVVEHANQLGMDSIITDHHLPESELPRALAVLNPKQPGCEYPDKELCGVGVAFKLVAALLSKTEGSGKLLESFLKIVAIGTIADVVPLTGENRVIAKFGLQGLRRPAHPGLRALIGVSGLAGKAIGSGDVGFRLAPRLNAAGRMDTANDVIRLFENTVDADAVEVAERLNKLNTERQEVQERALVEIEKLIEEQPSLLDQPAWVFEGEGWHRGVVGIVAGRLLEKYHRPVIVLALDETGAHGSGRSISKFHLLEALDAIAAQQSGLFHRYGGHAVAIGCSLDRARVAELRQALASRARAQLTAADLVPEIRIDAAVRLADVDDAMLDDLAALAPHGMANPAPLLGVRDLEVIAAPRVFGDGKHLSLRVRQDGMIRECIFWRRADLARYLAPGTAVAVAFHAERDEYQGESRIRLVAKDLKIQLKLRS
jgi:single-stranded-DNA-specific exonuclease